VVQTVSIQPNVIRFILKKLFQDESFAARKCRYLQLIFAVFVLRSANDRYNRKCFITLSIETQIARQARDRMSRVFINYRRQDSEGYVGRLYDHLCQHFNREDIFMDVDNLAPGVDFVAALEEAVSRCDVLIAVIGPFWNTISDEHGRRRLDQWNDFVRIEIANALKQGKHVIPVLVGHAQMPSPADLPEDIAALARRNAIELSHQRFSYDTGKLITAIKHSLPPAQTQTEVPEPVRAPAVKPLPDSDEVRQKAAEIKLLRDQLMKATDSPLYAHRIEKGYFPVLGDGSPDARILFIGEAPGKYEVERGKPFIGPSGDVFDEMLHSINLRREDIFITNILWDKPPEKRDPNPQEIAFYAPYMDRLIDIIQPSVIATLGRFAMSYILRKFDLPEKRGKISDLHGKLLKAQATYGEIHIVPLYHPAVVLYTASQKDTLRKDFQKLSMFT
jgi:uracil-DNA glycosylase